MHVLPPPSESGVNFCLHITLERENLPSHHETLFWWSRITPLCFTTKCTKGSRCGAQNVGRAMSSRDGRTWVRISFCHLTAGWPWASYLTSLCLGFHHDSNGDNSAYLVRLLWRLKEIARGKHLTQCQKFRKRTVNVGHCPTTNHF